MVSLPRNLGTAQRSLWHLAHRIRACAITLEEFPVASLRKRQTGCVIAEPIVGATEIHLKLCVRLRIVSGTQIHADEPQLRNAINGVLGTGRQSRVEHRRSECGGFHLWDLDASDLLSRKECLAPQPRGARRALLDGFSCRQDGSPAAVVL